MPILLAFAWLDFPWVCGRFASDAALDPFSPRRRPRVDWVQAQSDALARNALAPAAVRDAIIKESGAQAFRDRYAPLLSPP
jgi:2-polyprenyl-6-methoxyphenol hydroxylase-like FAD-dependent oxidoreductase